MTGAPIAAAFRPNAPGRVARLTLERTIIEVKQFFRSTELMFFTFLLPVLFVVIFSTIFSGDIEGPEGQTIAFAQYFVPGMIATGIMSATFANLATTIAVEQHDGLLRRLSATPLPRSAYFGGKVGLSLVIAGAEVVLILGIGVLAYGVKLPTDPQKWLVLAGVFFAGVSACSLLGIAYTRMIPSSSAAAAIVQPPYLVLQFISGVFLQFSVVPGFLQAVASIFPLKWMVQGLRYVFLPDWVSVQDYGGSWNVDRIFLALVLWCAVSFVAARLWFRWDRSAQA
ncbi:MAG TPA: ABC transporter permease [Tepidiformaceae bacterium]|nr:ABC transporter permease [Tepidiformaceae bacterium]HMO96992.1 ABC transporter permease [Tepidiformaceae bacterium]